MPDNIRETLYHVIPFLSLMSENPPENRPLLTRLVEQSLVGVVSGFLAIQVTQARQEEQLRALTTAITKQEQQAQRERDDLKATIDRIRADMYIPASKR
jgi:hypothetical protein